LFHVELDRRDGIRQINRGMLRFISFQQGQYDFKAVAFWQTRFRLLIKERGNLA